MKQWNEEFKKYGKIFAAPQESISDIISLFRKCGVKKILDLGCGSGRHVVHFAKQGFDVLFNSIELGIKKPDPKIYKLMAKKLKVLPDQCIFIDDNVLNTVGAEKVGMVGIVYKPGFHKEFIEQINKFLN